MKRSAIVTTSIRAINDEQILSALWRFKSAHQDITRILSISDIARTQTITDINLLYGL